MPIFFAHGHMAKNGYFGEIIRVIPKSKHSLLWKVIPKYPCHSLVHRVPFHSRTDDNPSYSCNFETDLWYGSTSKSETKHLSIWGQSGGYGSGKPPPPSWYWLAAAGWYWPAPPRWYWPAAAGWYWPAGIWYVADTGRATSYEADSLRSNSYEAGKADSNSYEAGKAGFKSYETGRLRSNWCKAGSNWFEAKAEGGAYPAASTFLLWLEGATTCLPEKQE